MLKEAILSRWREHFNALLNRPSAVKPGTIEGLQQAEVVHELDPPTNLAKKRSAKKYINQNRAKLQKRTAYPWSFRGCWTSTLRQVSFSLHTHIWETEKLPKDFKYTQITSIYKKKWERSDCKNYRGLALLTIAGKILATILLNRLVKHIADQNLSESQTIFSANRGTTHYLCSSSTPGEM